MKWNTCAVELWRLRSNLATPAPMKLCLIGTARIRCLS